MSFYWPSCSLTFCLLLFSLLFFHSVGWCCGVGVSGLIGCQSLSPSLALPAFFNNNNNNKHDNMHGMINSPMKVRVDYN